MAQCGICMQSEFVLFYCKLCRDILRVSWTGCFNIFQALLVCFIMWGGGSIGMFAKKGGTRLRQFFLGS